MALTDKFQEMICLRYLPKNGWRKREFLSEQSKNIQKKADEYTRKGIKNRIPLKYVPPIILNQNSINY